MSYWPGRDGETVSLGSTTHGELVSVRVRIEPRFLEDVLEALAQADFPINPEIRHGYPHTTVEFPAYGDQVEEVKNLLRHTSFRGWHLELASMLGAIA